MSITSTGAFTPLCFFSSKATMAAVTRSVSVSPAISSLAVAIVTLREVRYPLVCGWDGITRSRSWIRGFFSRFLGRENGGRAGARPLAATGRRRGTRVSSTEFRCDRTDNRAHSPVQAPCERPAADSQGRRPSKCGRHLSLSLSLSVSDLFHRALAGCRRRRRRRRVHDGTSFFEPCSERGRRDW